MTTQHSRRSFLAAGAAAVASGLATRDARAAEPLPGNGKSHMKLSLAAYSFNRFLPRPGRDQSGEMTLDDFIDYCAELDLDGTELTSYYFTQETPEYLLALKQRCFRLGLDVSGTAIGNDFCLPEGQKRTEQLDLCKRWIDHAAVLGAPVIRIFAGKVAKGDTEEVALDRCVAGINECLDYAATKGVFLALENHGGITATPQQLLAIVKRVKDSPWFGINFDGGNFRTDDPYGDLEQIAPYAINAQIKVAVTAKGEKQPADLPRMVNILKAANYRGYVVLEYEEGKPREEIPEYIKQLRELCS
jgi:sugar phosphate isomerase/epimerase